MTSNLGSQMIQQMAGDDYQVIKLAVMAEVKSYFRPEFINRHRRGRGVPRAWTNGTSPASPASSCKYLEKRLAQMEMKLEVSDAALAELAKAGFDPVYGARPLKRAIQQELENPLSKEILSGRFGPKDVIRVDVEDGRFTFENLIEG